MHELSIAQSIIDLVRQHVPEDQEADVRIIRVKIGPMAGVVSDSLDFCFNAMVTGTSLDTARLHIEETPLRSQCAACGETFAVQGAAFLCPKCGGGEVRIVSGTELQVVEIELSDQQAGAV